jgi:hypothetical protein
MKVFPYVRIEGGLLGPDTLERLLAGKLPGQEPKDFGLDGRRTLTDEIASVFADARAEWEVFQRRLERLPEGEPATSVTRDAWMIPFLSLLGYELRYNPRAYDVDGMTYAISHRAGEAEDAPPVHIVGARQELGRLPPSGRPRLAPHSLLQEFLNRTEHLWGIVTNGLTLRLLRNSTYIRRQAYIEFDLAAILEEQRFEDFVALYRLLHRTRLPKTVAEAHQCLLERYFQHSLEQGGRVRDRLRDGVEECIRRLANGFLSHSANSELRRRVDPACTEPDRIEPLEFYRQLLRLVYRLLFLLVSEDRGLISRKSIYREHYGVARLRNLVDNRNALNAYEDIWLSLRVLWKVLLDERFARLLEVAPLNGELFAPLDLDAYSITNRNLLGALWYLVYYEENGVPRRVNYAALDTEELGSVYESLLEHHPHLDFSGPVPTFDLVAGTERKSTGSYYTPPELVAELIRSALEPVIKERLKGTRTLAEKEHAILSIRVCDPACGSGHFLLAAARRLGKELARIRTGEEEPAPERVREAIRDVVAHCIYGVDKNPLAVELCRVALWLEAHCEGKPLTFLDHRIRCGDSLVGVLDMGVLKAGIPDEAFEPVAEDDKQVARTLKKQNKTERGGQYLLAFEPYLDINRAAEALRPLLETPDDTPAQIHEKAKTLLEWEKQTERDRTAGHIWTAAFFQSLAGQNSWAITTDALFRYMDTGTCHGQVLGNALALAHRHRFFHWPLEFPEVFAEGGFDVVLCNPPWERIKLQEEEFFATRDKEIANAPNKAARQRLIRELPTRNPKLWEEYQQALHDADALSKFLRRSNRFPLTARGDINTYSVFAELFTALVNDRGRVGVVLPTGIATDSTNQQFFRHLVDTGRLVSLYDFENREKLFPAVDSRYKFSLLTLSGKPAGQSEFAFFLTRTEQMRDPQRRFALAPEDLALLNPNTRTCPVFRTRQDAELTKAVYRRVPVLVNEAAGENPWGVRFLRMLDMANDSHLFRTRAELEAQGYRLVGNVFVKEQAQEASSEQRVQEVSSEQRAVSSEGDIPLAARHSLLATAYLPLYEAKMIWHYDHRFGTYAGVASRSSTELPTPTPEDHADPAFVVQPWYWVPAEEVEARLSDWKRGWLLGFRDVARSTDERTAIFSLLPRVGVGHKAPLLISEKQSTPLISALLANLTGIVFDFITRQKIGGTSLGFFILRQLPVLPPRAYTPEDLGFIVPRVLELVYTAWDIKPFADDLWREAGESLRARICRQWEENAAETGGHRGQPPEWADIAPDGIPLPPFRWDEDRRARLRAELDAIYARLYGLTRKQLRYILDPADLTEKELADILDPWEEVADPLDPQGYAGRCAKSTFPGETFRVLKEKELRQYGEYRSRRLVLEAWRRLCL